MRTSKTLSCISYNTREWLLSVLQMLVEDGVLSNYWGCFHEADVDSKKPHCHVTIVPSRSIDTEIVFPKFNEIVPEEALPRKLICIDSRRGGLEFCKSLGDNYLYNKHDSQYLAFKHLERNVKDYGEESMFFSSEEFKEVLIDASRQVQETLYPRDARIYIDLANGCTSFDLMLEGYSSQQIESVRRNFNADRNREADALRMEELKKMAAESDAKEQKVLAEYRSLTSRAVSTISWEDATQINLFDEKEN